MKFIKILLFLGGMWIAGMGLILLAYPDSSGQLAEELGEAYASAPIIMTAIGLIVMVLCAIPSKHKTFSGKTATFKRPIPVALIYILWFVAILGGCLLISRSVDKQDTIAFLNSYQQFFVDNLVIFVILFVIIGIVNAVIYKRYELLDEKINSVFNVGNNSLTIVNMFFIFFSATSTKGPLAYYYDDFDIVNKRRAFTLANIIIKFVCGTAIMVPMFVGTYVGFLGEGTGEIIFSGEGVIALFALLCLPHLDVLFYTLLRMMPLHQVTGYTTTITKYSDGTTSSETKTNTNLIAILFLAFVMFICSSFFYILPVANRISRLVETRRLQKYLDEERSAISIEDYYEL